LTHWEVFLPFLVQSPWIADPLELDPILHQVKVKVTLRLTVSQSVSLDVKPHLGLMTRYLFLSDSYGIVFLWGALSDERAGLSLTDSHSHSHSHIATDGQSVSKSWYRAPSEAHDQIFISVGKLRS
jgi:hypothetical protein